MSNTPKRGRGRPKGSTSFVKIRLSDLIDNFGKNASIPVSKRWLEGVGFDFDEKPAPKVEKASPVRIAQVAEEQEPEQTIQFNIY